MAELPCAERNVSKESNPQELDICLMELLDAADDYIVAQSHLQEALKSGFFALAQARYGSYMPVLGVRDVGLSQHVQVNGGSVSNEAQSDRLSFKIHHVDSQARPSFHLQANAIEPALQASSEPDLRATHTDSGGQVSTSGDSAAMPQDRASASPDSNGNASSAILRGSDEAHSTAALEFSDMSSLINDLAAKFCSPEDAPSEQIEEPIKAFKPKKLSPQMTKCQEKFKGALGCAEAVLNSQQRVLQCLSKMNSLSTA